VLAKVKTNNTNKMFKKRARKDQNLHARRKRNDDDDIDDGDDTDQAGSENQNDDEVQAILTKTKERRALIHHLQFKRGVDAHELLQQGNKSSNSIQDDLKINVVAGNATVEGSHTNLSTRVDALSSKTQLPTGGTIVAEEQRIWDQKHAAAMEEYVQQQLLLSSQQNNLLSHNDGTRTSEESEDTDISTVTKSIATTKEQLYRDLAAQAAQLSGKAMVGSVTTSTEPNGILRHDDSNSTDVLTAGAATAIMEVILPIDERLQAVAATTRAAAAMATSNPTTTPQTLLYVRNKSSAVPNRFRSSYNHHHPVVHYHNGNNNNNDGKKRPHDNSVVSSSESSSTVDRDRPGFAAARQLQQQNRSFQGTSFGGGIAKNNNNNYQQHSRSTDDRVYQQFIKRQREQQGR
jgi:hypothetical protein